jgi:hypothetical protein
MHTLQCDSFLPSFNLIVWTNHGPLTEKATWWGCGNHISSVMDSIPEEERCTCGPKVEFQGKEYPPKQGTGQSTSA